MLLTYKPVSIFFLRACLPEGGGSQVGEVTCRGSPRLTCKRDHIEMKNYLDRRVTPPKGVISPTWSPPLPCKQALNRACFNLVPATPPPPPPPPTPTRNNRYVNGWGLLLLYTVSLGEWKL